jgi:hypothetical protein
LPAIKALAAIALERQAFPGKKMTRDKFSFQISDHLPVWIQVKTDIDGFRLDQLVQDGKKE